MLSPATLNNDHRRHHNRSAACQTRLEAIQASRSLTGCGRGTQVIAANESRYSHREEVLHAATDAVLRSRNADYGPPHQDFARTAAMMTAAFGREFAAHEVAMTVAFIKLSRLCHSPLKLDNWVDLAGYAACGYEAAKMTLPDGA